MDLVETSSNLNNKQVVTILEKESSSYKKFGPEFIGRLVGRTLDKSKALAPTVLSLTILTQNYIAYVIPVEDIKMISELFL